MEYYRKTSDGTVFKTQSKKTADLYEEATEEEFNAANSARDSESAAISNREDSRAQLAEQFQALDLSTRSQFATVEMTINRRLDMGDYEGAYEVLNITVVPAELEETKTGFLTQLAALRDA